MKDQIIEEHKDIKSLFGREKGEREMGGACIVRENC